MRVSTIELPRRGGEGKPIRLSQAPRPNLPIYLATLGPKSLQADRRTGGWLAGYLLPAGTCRCVHGRSAHRRSTKPGRSLAHAMDIEAGGYFEDQ